MTNDPSTIGGHVSSGCIRLVNEDVIELYNRVHVSEELSTIPMVSEFQTTAEHRLGLLERILRD